MSEVDASIPLSVKPAQFDNPQDIQAKGLQLSALSLQNQGAQRDYDNQQKLSDIYAQNIGADGSVDHQGVIRSMAGQGLGYMIPATTKSLLDAQKTQADIEETKAKGGAETATAQTNQFELHQKKLDYMAGQLNNLAQGTTDPTTGQRIPASAQDVTNAIHNAVDGGYIDAATGAQMVRTIPGNPNAIPGFLQTAIANTQTAQQQLQAAKDRAPEKVVTDTGPTVRIDNRDPITGALTPGTTISKAPTPDEAAKLQFQKSGALTDDAKMLAVNRLLNGEKPGAVLGNMGRGAQGAADLRDIQNLLATEAKNRGIDASGILSATQGVMADNSAATVLGHREGAIAPRVEELKTFVQQARDASAAVPRGNWTDANKLFQYGAAHSSDANLARLQTTVDGVINARAAAIGGGQIHVADQIEGHKLLAAAQGPEAFNAVMDQFEQEANGALAAPGKVRQSMGIGTKANPPGSAPTAPAGAVVPIKSDADYNALPSGTPFIAPDGSHRVKP